MWPIGLGFYQDVMIWIFSLFRKAVYVSFSEKLFTCFRESFTEKSEINHMILTVFWSGSSTGWLEQKNKTYQLIVQLEVMLEIAKNKRKLKMQGKHNLTASEIYQTKNMCQLSGKYVFACFCNSLCKNFLLIWMSFVFIRGV